MCWLPSYYLYLENAQLEKCLQPVHLNQSLPDRRRDRYSVLLGGHGVGGVLRHTSLCWCLLLYPWRRQTSRGEEANPIN